jgi:hypothetical protein
MASGLHYPLALALTLRALSAGRKGECWRVLAGRSRKWLAKARLFWYRMTMSKVLEIESALRQLPTQDQWEVARWLLDALEEGNGSAAKGQNGGSVPALPDYAARRRQIFGDKVLPNMVLVSRSEERW